MAATSAQADTTSSLHLLLVEDDPDEQLLFSIAARKTKLDLRIHPVMHGAEAIAYLEGVFPCSNRTLYPLPDLIVLDVKMPIMDGCELLRWLKASPQFHNLPAVVLSGSLDEGLRNRVQALGACMYLEKPFGIVKWVAMMRQIWEFARRPSVAARSQTDTTSAAAV